MTPTRRSWIAMGGAVMVAMAALSSPAEDVDAIDDVVVGIRGHYRVGRTTAIRYTGDRTATPTGLESLDGDGVRVAYDALPGGNGGVGYVVPGSEAAPLVLRFEDGEDVQSRFPIAGVPAQGPSMIPPDMPWVVCIGDTLGVDQIGVSELLNRQSRIAVSLIEAAASLPDRSLGYDGVDMVMINGGGADVLKGLTGAQQSALARWIREGGNAFVCLGDSAEEVAEAAPWLIDLLPLDDVEVVRLDPAALETFTTSQTPLAVFRGIKLPRRTGRILLAGRTTRRVSAVLAAEYVTGFGQITVAAADLDSDVFSDWPERLGLVTQLTGDVLKEPDRDRVVQDRSTSFDDLAGQMRATLDQFEIKSRFSFSLVALILMLLVAALGPIDYLLVNRALGRPLLGWLTFPLMALALSAFLIYQAQPQLSEGNAAGDSLLRANQFQVVDIDRISGVGRAFTWAYLYTHDPAKASIQFQPTAQFAEMRSSEDRAQARMFTHPMGYPGKTFGGVQLAGENSLLPAYSIVQSESGAGEFTFAIQDLAIAPRSSKSVATRSGFVPSIDRDIDVIRRPGSELLRGKLVNPLPIDLLDGMLIYRNWVYLLPTRFPAGSEIPSITDLRQKNFRWLLTRQQAFEKNVTETTPWSAGDYSNPRRVAEMLLFHKAAGGELYTGLKDGSLSTLDLSHLLVDDRCLLVGRSEQPLLELGVQSSGDEPAVTPEGEVLSTIRVVLPVRSTRLD